MRLSELCHNDCGKPWQLMHSFMIGRTTYRFCGDGCLESKLQQLKCAEVV